MSSLFKMNKKISIIIINYNTENYIAELLHSISFQSMTVNEFEIIIVNNSAPSGELYKHINLFNFNIFVIDAEYNLGFGAGCNLGAASANGEYLLFLNPDIQLREFDFLNHMYRFASEAVGIGVFSSKVIETRENGHKLQIGPYYSYAYNWKPTGLPGEIASVIGAVMLIKKDIFVHVDGFDEDFFLYEEDVDICYRIRKIGYQIEVLQDLTVEHVGGVSEKGTKIYEYKMKKMRGIYLFCLKHFPPSLFQELLKKDIRLSHWKKMKLWCEINIFQLKYKKDKYVSWCALFDAAKKTKYSTEWLFNRCVNRT